MRIESPRACTETFDKVPVLWRQSEKTTPPSASRSLPIGGILHVGLPRMLPLTLRGVLAQEILLPSLGEETQW